ncbi:MAG: NAD(P)-dependent oxidoreductase [Planctomycetes bacterium]|nr:NAD(P)-dependent oxidoreductase [Planctomycetota bacterium]
MHTINPANINVRAGGGVAVVTGGLGFVGTHVVRELLSRGRRVRILDDGSNACDASREAFAHVNDVEVVDGSTLSRETVRNAVAGASELYHLAAIVGVRRVAADPAFVLQSNRLGAETVFGECERAGVPVLYMSSSEVYGSGAAGRAFRENDAPGFCIDRISHDGRAAYAYSKWLGERLALEAAARGHRIVSVRPFNIVGAAQSEASGSLVPSLVAAALRGENLRLEGDGGATRAFAWAPEVARALVELLHCDAAFGSIVNVGGTDVRTIRSVAELILQITGSDSKIQFRESVVPRGVTAVAHRRADLSRLCEWIGWAPSAPLSRAVLDAVEFASGRIAAPAAAIV